MLTMWNFSLIDMAYKFIDLVYKSLQCLFNTEIVYEIQNYTKFTIKRSVHVTSSMLLTNLTKSFDHDLENNKALSVIYLRCNVSVY